MGVSTAIKRLRLPAGKNTHEHMGRIVPKEDLRHRLVDCRASLAATCNRLIHGVMIYNNPSVPGSRAESP
jgi:hypothetical protein